MKDLLEKSIKDSESFSIKSAMPALRLLNSGALEDVLNVNGCRYYQFFPCLIDNIKPHQIVELGGAMGVADVMMLQSKWQDYKLYSITLEEHGLEFSMIADEYKNLIKVVGDDLDLKAWPKDLDLSKTDLFFVDTLHTKEQLTKELELYTKFFKKGAIVLFDDIHMPELQPVWDLLCQRYDHYDCTDPCHYSGFGAIQI
jgi:predicted O-methyltransferase YrrM